MELGMASPVWDGDFGLLQRGTEPPGAMEAPAQPPIPADFFPSPHSEFSLDLQGDVESQNPGMLWIGGVHLPAPQNPSRATPRDVAAPWARCPRCCQPSAAPTAAPINLGSSLALS